MHSDVAPNNIVRASGVWKLIDLNQVAREGEPVTGLPKAGRYVLDSVQLGDPARPEMDTHGLSAILAEIRSRSAPRPSPGSSPD